MEVRTTHTPVSMQQLIQYNQVAEADWETLRHIHTLFEQECLNCHPFEGADSLAFEALFLSNNSQVIVALDDSRVIGFAIKAEFVGINELLACFVAKEYRLQGIGSHLVHHAFRLFPGDWQIKMLEDDEKQGFIQSTLSRYQVSAAEQQLIADPCFGLVNQHTFYISQSK